MNVSWEVDNDAVETGVVVDVNPEYLKRWQSTRKLAHLPLERCDNSDDVSLHG